MPWLVLTTYLHYFIKIPISIIRFNEITILLSSLSYYLSILGTFFIRSGFLNSVHSFASDTSRGVFILIYLIVMFITFQKNVFIYLYFNKSKSILSINKSTNDFFIILKSIIFFFILITIFIGTFFPSFSQFILLKDISIGTSYYQDTLLPSIIPLLILMNLVPYIKKSSVNFKSIYNNYPLKSFFYGSLTLLIIFYIKYIVYENILSYSNGVLLVLLILMFVYNMIHYYFYKSSLSMLMAHNSVVFFFISLIISQVGYNESTQLLIPGEKIQIQNKIFILGNINYIKDSNYYSLLSTVIIKDTSSNKIIGVSFPEKRFYFKKNIFTTKTSISSNINSDIYSNIGDGNILYGWQTRFFYYPLMPYI